MASATKSGLDDSRRSLGSPKLRGRENTKDTLCRNITIYGKCRFEDKGCAFNHDPQKLYNANQNDSKKRLNVDSPSFTPAVIGANGSSSKKPNSISPKAAVAAPFLPKASGTSTPPIRPDTASSDWTVAEVPDFVPQGLDASQVQVSLQGNPNGVLNPAAAYDPFVTTPGSLAASGSVTSHPVQGNPYSHDAAAAVAASMGGTAFFSGQAGFQQPVQYHLYAPVGPHSQNIHPHNRNVHDLFLPNDFREELQKKAAATLQTLPNSSLPAHVDNFHSLVPLDLSHQKNASIFGYPSWVYKAQSGKDGNFYALRRLEGFRLTNEKAIRSVQAWKKVTNGSVVTVHDAFTTRVFQDSSLVFVMDYHPLSKTLAEQHLGAGSRYAGRATTAIPEAVMWSYVTQIASALKAIHSAKLAARIIDPSKIILTGKNRIRLSACAIMDVVQHDTQRSIEDLQHQDLVNFGQLMLALGASASGVVGSPTKSMEYFSRAYSPQLKNSVIWLLNAMQMDQERNIDIFISGISSQLISTFDSALHMDDQLTSDISRELENGRLVRLLTKLNFVNERPEYEHDRQWSENGERYFLKLFRDYVFHQVDSQNSPVVDLGHVLNCLNKLDAGTEEKVTLISRDEQSCFIVSYKELKKALESSFQALMKPTRRMH
ncbi:putative poly(A)-binding protein-dependent poly(A) ribonuclease [Talaromyces proteolyticus]|uniref:PAN2-PAN3 deadenylation complex subunit PAN3 n=1 Tax=Talaromyces proteolyticus TaxID=1131652 RepID=A0AAD4KUF8_9EURO|nr:putative poly(A)-binding protein-dependent poly(A) ribonuclease [Talaromyces proteolyticus]KAH8699010.1 putative poly(A)-binding protein-dependent poly(A) ribonuclease [Talaromyces proteolyticus]